MSCPSGTSLGTLLPTVDLNNPGTAFKVEAVLKNDGTVSSYNPGLMYAVSTVDVPVALTDLFIKENYSDCTNPSAGQPLLALNPGVGGGGGNIVIADVDTLGVATQILDSKSPSITYTGSSATAHVTSVPAGHKILMYVKFGPGVKGQALATATHNPCKNTNKVSLAATGFPSATAIAHLIVTPKP